MQKSISTWRVFVVASYIGLLLFAGCNDSKSGTSVAGGASQPKSVAFAEFESEDWLEFGEVVGDESYMYAKATPEQPKPREKFKVEVQIGSWYGFVKPRVWIRIGNSTPRDVNNQPNEDDKWFEMKVVGGMLWDYKTQKMVPMGQTKVAPRDAQPGESYYEIELTMPEVGSTVEFRLEDKLIDEKPVIFAAWKLADSE